MITIRPTYRIKLHAEFAEWLDSLRDGMTKRRFVARLRKASLGNLGDIKPVGVGVWEMRESFGPGWRMYFTRRGDTVIVMLGGGSKATQRADIECALRMAALLED
ncbi:MAG: type II toxin-antitoxin system RelE/ParE family toxin [Burkholderiaceae bacterium]|nr:type II toxin-antitoxin system RelE/ParE family toxin [Burkholderiaceae bacterium]